MNDPVKSDLQWRFLYMVQCSLAWLRPSNSSADIEAITHTAYIATYVDPACLDYGHLEVKVQEFLRFALRHKGPDFTLNKPGWLSFLSQPGDGR